MPSGTSKRILEFFKEFWFVWIPIGLILLITMLSSPRRTPKRLFCLNNLHQVILSILNFASANDDQLPPLSNRDNHLSWRVMMLPMLDQAAMYRAYHHDKAWNDPANWEFTRTNISVFSCQSNPTPHDSQGRFYTSIVMLTGPGTAYDRAETRSMNELPHGVSQTILTIEACGANIIWNEPRDLDVEKNQILTDVSKNTIHTLGNWTSPHHKNEAIVAFADGSVRTLSLNTDPDVFQRLSMMNKHPKDEEAP